MRLLYKVMLVVCCLVLGACSSVNNSGVFPVNAETDMPIPKDWNLSAGGNKPLPKGWIKDGQ